MKKFLLITLFSNYCFAGVFLENLPQSDKIFRGRAPKQQEIQKMKEIGITSVLIFKNQTKDEVDTEVRQLINAGFDSNKIYKIPFLWKDFKSQRLACEQVLDALKILIEIERSSNDKVLFHCTVGEDRTGLLAGLMTQLMTQTDAHETYMNQMCLKGYSGGNTEKPLHVQNSVDRYLTPLYFKLSEQIKNGSLTMDNLDKNICRNLYLTKNKLQPCAELLQLN